MLGEFLLYSVRISARLVDLVNGNDDRHSGCLGVADGLDGLRHYAVICSDYQYGDIRYLCASGTHRCESFVSRCIKKYDLLSVDFDFGSTDVLCDTAGLACCNVGVADGVQKRSLTVVYVTHYGDDRRTRLEFTLGVLMHVDARLFDLRFFFRYDDLKSEVFSKHLNSVLVERLVDRSHYSHLHHGHDDLAYADLSLLGETRYRDRYRYRDGAFRQEFLNCRLLYHLGLVFSLMTLLLLQRGFVIDVVIVVAASARAVFASVEA